MADETLTRIVRYLADTQKAVAEIDKLTRATDRTAKEMATVGDQLSKFTKFAATGFGLYAAVGIIGDTARMFKGLVNELDELEETAESIGLTTQQLSGLQYAADFAGVKAEKLTGALVKLNDKLANVESGTDSASRILRSFGVTSADDTAKAMDKIADAFARAPDGPTKTAYALELFGKAGAALIPLMNQGAAGIKKFTDEGERLGATITPELAALAGEFNDNLGKLAASGRALGLVIAKDLLPPLVELTKFWLENVRAYGFWSGTMQSVMEKALGSEGERLDKALRDQMKRVDQMRAIVEETKVSGGVLGFFKDADVAARTNVLKQEEAALAKIVSEYNLYLDLRNQGNAVTTTTTEKNDKLNAGLLKTEKSVKAIREEVGKIPPDPMQEFLRSIEKVGQDEQDIPAKLQAIAERMELVANEGASAAGKLKALGEAYKDLLAKISPEAAVANAIEDMRLATEAANKFNVALAESVLRGEISAEAAKGLYKQIPGAAREATEATQQLSTTIQDSLIASTQSWVDTLVDGIGEANQSFQEFITNALKAIAKLIIQQQVLQAFRSIGFGAAAQGAAFAGPNVQYMAQGGILTSPRMFATAGRLAVAGEAGPEAVVPLRRNSSGDLGVAASPVVINITNNSDTEVSQRTSDNSDGSRVVDILIERKVRTMMADGSMDRTMRATYGLTRQPG